MIQVTSTFQISDEAFAELTRGVDSRLESKWQQVEIDKRVGALVERHAYQAVA